MLGSAAYDAATLREAATLRFTVYGELVLIHSDQRWIGGMKPPYLYFSNWNPAYCQRLWEAHCALEREAALQARQAFASEHAMLTALVTALQAHGWDCQREVYTAYGRVDVVAARATGQLVIEGKFSTGQRALTMALGQLLMARQAYPTAALWLALPTTLDSRHAQVFAHYDIHVMEVPWNRTALMAALSTYL
jgi:hypothetical protein